MKSASSESPKTSDAPQSPAELQVDLASPDNVNRWLRELDVTRDQLEAAVQKVGTRAADVEFYLKGSRSSTNADEVPGSEGA